MKRSVRQREILRLLQDREEISVEEACESFQISQATARRDFATLAEEGRVEKTWGGVRSADPRANPMLPSGLRENLNSSEKHRIGARAAEMCRDGDIVFVDGGTTTSQMARWLAARPVRVVTNSLLIAHEIDRQRTDAQGAEVFLTGGYLYPGSGLLVGPETVESVRRYRAVTAFLSVGGITEEGFANNHHLVVEVERAMISRASRVVLLADHSKFGRRELVSECSWDEVDVVVTDRPPDETFRKLLADRVVIAE